MSTQKFIDPRFSLYDPKLAEAMTTFLHADPTAPNSGRPELWSQTGLVRYVSRVLSFSSVASGGGTSTERFDINGGRNCIIFGRVASVVPSSATTPIVSPNERAKYARVEVTRTDQVKLDPDQPINNCFGDSADEPMVYPSPNFHPGSLSFNVTVTNNNTANVDIDLTWFIAILDTAR